MGFRAKNGRKRLDALTSVKARDGSEAVLAANPTEGAVNSGHISPHDPRKPEGLLAVARRNLSPNSPALKRPRFMSFRPNAGDPREFPT